MTPWRGGAGEHVRCAPRSRHRGATRGRPAVQKFKERAVERFLDRDERQALERVLTAAEHIPSGQPGHIGHQAVWAVRLLAITGMRRDEVGPEPDYGVPGTT